MKGIKTDLVLLLFCLSILAVTTSLIGGITAAIIYLTTVLMVVNKDGSSSFHRRPFILSVLFEKYKMIDKITVGSVVLMEEIFREIMSATKVISI